MIIAFFVEPHNHGLWFEGCGLVQLFPNEQVLNYLANEIPIGIFIIDNIVSYQLEKLRKLDYLYRPMYQSSMFNNSETHSNYIYV